MEVPPLLVQVLGGNVVTAVSVLACLNTASTPALRRLHPALAAAVAAVPWADTNTGTYVRDPVRWRAALPVATALYTKCIHPFSSQRDIKLAALGGVTVLDYRGASAGDILHLPPTLRTLNVARTGLEPASFTHLTALEVLDCSETFALTAGLSRLPPSLRELHMNFCRLPDTADFSHLRQLRVVMCSRYDALSSAAVASLPQSLEVLDISCSSLNDYTPWPRGWSLAHLTHLRELFASCTNIDADAIASLPPSLRVLDLADCVTLSYRYTGAPAFSLAHLTCLHTLNLTDTPISSATLATLPPSLVSLDLHGSRYDIMLTATTVFPHLPALRVLNVSRSRLGDAAVASMPAGLEELHMVCCSAVTPHARLRHMAALRVLQSAGTDLSPVTIAACRARGCFAPADGILELDDDQEVYALAPLPDGRLVSGTYSGCMMLWEAAAGRRGVVVKVLELGRVDVRALVVLHDGHRVAVGTSGGIVVWDTRDTPYDKRAADTALKCTRRIRVRALAVAHNGWLVAGCYDGQLHVVDAEAGAVVATLKAHCTPVVAVVGLLGGRVASASADGELKLWDLGTRTCISALRGHTDGVSSLAVLPDGRLASGSTGNDDTVRMWDTVSGICIRVLTGHIHNVRALAVLPGDQLASLSEDGTIRVWDTRDDPCGSGGALAEPPLIVEYAFDRTPKALAPLSGNRLAAGGKGGVHLYQLPSPRGA